MPTSISRDPFARGNVTRERVYVVADHCQWCGQVKRTPNGRTFLYRYGWDDDQGPRQSGQDARLFCSKGCRDSFCA